MKLTGENGFHAYRGLKAPATSLQGQAELETAGSEPTEPTGGASVEVFTPSARPHIPDRAERKALVQAYMESGQQAAQKTAVVIGAGPGGLAAAITLAKMGMKVTVLEARANETGDKPAHTRPHQISLRQDALETLKSLNAYDQVMESTGFVEKEVHIHHDGRRKHVTEKVPEGQAQEHHEARVLRPTLLHTDSVSQVRISDIEKSLLAQAEEMGIEIKSGVAAELTRSANGTSYDVSYRKVAKDGDGYQPFGDSTELGTADLVVAADGAGSPMRQQLGIDVLEESKPKHYLGGHIQQGIGAETRKAVVAEASGMKRHLMATGHAKYDATWVSVEITPEEANLPPEQRAKLLADKSQWVMMKKVGVEDIGWGAGQVTTVQNRRAEITTAGDNVVLFGDAAGTGSVWVGGGLNLALTTHLSALRSLASRIMLGADRPASLHIYDRTVQWATSVWHRAGAAELGVEPTSGQGKATIGLSKKQIS